MCRFKAIPVALKRHITLRLLRLSSFYVELWIDFMGSFMFQN